MTRAPTIMALGWRHRARVGESSSQRHDPRVSDAIRFVRPTALTGDVPYAYAAVTGPGRTVFTAGACPLDADGGTVAIGDAAGQARQVMANLATTLAAAGAELTDVVKTTVYVASADRRDLAAAWDVVRRAFGDHDAPSTLLGVTVLGYADQLVEVEAIAVTGSVFRPPPTV
jgi:enamine deaminase RidA (YjgF/YER057c/UK114 family)